MRQLTLNGFLMQYMAELSLNGTNSITKLYREKEKNSRVFFPIAYYLYLTGEMRTFCSSHPDITEEIKRIRDGEREQEILKIRRSYSYQVEKKSREDNLKELMFKRIVELKEEKHISTYRIYTDLKLDPSNTTQYIRNCNVDRLTKDTANRILNYVEQYGD